MCSACLCSAHLCVLLFFQRAVYGSCGGFGMWLMERGSHAPVLAAGQYRCAADDFETCGWTLPAAALSPAESVGDLLWRGYNFTLGRDMDILLYPFCLFIRWALFKDKNVPKSPKFSHNKGKEKGSRLLDEILEQHLMWNYLGSPVFPNRCWIWYEQLEAASEVAVAGEQLHCSTSTDTI